MPEKYKGYKMCGCNSLLDDYAKAGWLQEVPLLSTGKWSGMHNCRADVDHLGTRLRIY